MKALIATDAFGFLERGFYSVLVDGKEGTRIDILASGKPYRIPVDEDAFIEKLEEIQLRNLNGLAYERCYEDAGGWRLFTAFDEVRI